MTAPDDAALVRAYLRTRWTGEAGPGRVFDLGIGEGGSAARALEALGTATAAIVTAANPRSRPMKDDENRDRNRALRRAIDDRAWPCLPCTGRGAGSDAEWQEASFLVGGLELDDAIGLGRDWEQNAIVWLERGADPVLVVTRHGFAGRPVGSRIGAMDADV